jgi:hypothetical protein
MDICKLSDICISSERPLTSPVVFWSVSFAVVSVPWISYPVAAARITHTVAAILVNNMISDL